MRRRRETYTQTVNQVKTWNDKLEDYVYHKIKRTSEYDDSYLKRCKENVLREKIRNGIRYSKTFEYEMFPPEHFYKEVINGMISWDSINNRLFKH